MRAVLLKELDAACIAAFTAGWHVCAIDRMLPPATAAVTIAQQKPCADTLHNIESPTTIGRYFGALLSKYGCRLPIVANSGTPQQPSGDALQLPRETN